MSPQLILIIKGLVGFLVVGLVFWGGYSLGYHLRRKKLTPEDFRILGEKFEENMVSLREENKAHLKLWKSMGDFLAKLGAIKGRDKLSAFMTRFIKQEVKANYTAVLMKQEDTYSVMASEGLHTESEKVLSYHENDTLMSYLGTFPDVVTIKRGDRQFKSFKDLQEDLEYIVIMPLKVGETVHGMLWLARKRGARPFSEGQMSLVHYLGNSFGYLISNLELILQNRERTYKIISSLARTIEQKNQFFEGHSDNVASYAVAFARHVSCSPKEIEAIKRSALFHDIGMLTVPEAILSKTDKLTEDEYEIVKTHSIYGAEILKHLDFLRDEMYIVLHHHENFNGSGYPYGLTGAKIPKGAAIVHLANVFDALTNDRPYRKAYSIEKAIEIMESMSGIQFDPMMLDQFLSYVKTRLKNAQQA